MTLALSMTLPMTLTLTLLLTLALTLALPLTPGAPRRGRWRRDAHPPRQGGG